MNERDHLLLAVGIGALGALLLFTAIVLVVIVVEVREQRRHVKVNAEMRHLKDLTLNVLNGRETRERRINEIAAALNEHAELIEQLHPGRKVRRVGG